MEITAAFLWNSTEKSISYIIIDEDYDSLVQPTTTKEIKQGDLKAFCSNTQKVIQTFFDRIKDVYNEQPGCTIKIEYKIVGHGSPAQPYHTQLHKPSDNTEFVRKKFFELFHDISEKNKSIVLADTQYRTKLKKPELAEFKKGLDGLHLVPKVKGNAYVYHLWALALHATKSNYKKQLKKLTQIVKPVKEIEKDERKRRKASD